MPCKYELQPTWYESVLMKEKGLKSATQVKEWIKEYKQKKDNFGFTEWENNQRKERLTLKRDSVNYQQ